jgi:hypothetical protein
MFHSLLIMPHDPIVAVVLRTVPEFSDRYLELVEAADGDPGLPAAMSELAEFVAELAGAVDRPRAVLERCLAAVEEVATTAPDPVELVGWAFLDSLTPEETARLRPWIGPRTMAILGALDDDGIDDEEVSGDGEEPGGEARAG